MAILMFVLLPQWLHSAFFTIVFHSVVDCIVVPVLMMVGLGLMQTKAAHGPVGAASEGK